MKKTIVTVALTASLISSGVTFAATNYYADLVTGQKEQIKTELLNEYKERKQHMSKQVHNDMVMYASTSRDKLVKEVNSYMQEKLNQEQQDRMNMHAAEINKAVESLEADLKAYIDELVE